jgi:hypothetical protein
MAQNAEQKVTAEIHSDAVSLLRKINSQIVNMDRVETINLMMTGVIRELNGQIVDDIILNSTGNDAK